MTIRSIEPSRVLDGTYKKITKDLVANSYPVGTKIQPLRELAKRYKVSYLTVQKAIKALQIQGVLEAKPGDGIYVVGSPDTVSDQIPDHIEEQEFGKNGHLKPKNGKNGVQRRSLCVVMPYWMSDRGSACIYNIIKGILAASDPYHWPIELIHSCGDETFNDSAHPDFIDKIDYREADGVIWIQPILMHKMNLMRLVDRGYKVVVTGRPFKEVPVKCIHMDFGDMADKVAGYFQARGSQKIGMIAGHMEGQFEDQYSVQIVQEICQAMNRIGMPFSEENICQAGYRPIHGPIIRDYFIKNPDVDGIICLHEHILEEIERMDKGGLFRSKIPLVDVSGIFNYTWHQYKQIEHVNVLWPLENMGRAVIREFENEWLGQSRLESVDLSVKLIEQ